MNTRGYIDWGPLLILALIGLFGVAIAFAVYRDIHQASAERQCLAHGWPSADWRWIGPAYCIKRVNQTDTVAVLDSVLRH